MLSRMSYAISSLEIDFLHRIKYAICINQSTKIQMALEEANGGIFVIKSIKTNDHGCWEICTGSKSPESWCQGFFDFKHVLQDTTKSLIAFQINVHQNSWEASSNISLEPKCLIPRKSWQITQKVGVALPEYTHNLQNTRGYLKSSTCRCQGVVFSI